MVFGSWVPPPPAPIDSSPFCFEFHPQKAIVGKAASSRRSKGITLGFHWYRHFHEGFAQMYNDKVATVSMDRDEGGLFNSNVVTNMTEQTCSLQCLLSLIEDPHRRDSSSHSCNTVDILQDFVDVLDKDSFGLDKDAFGLDRDSFGPEKGFESDDDQSLSPTSPTMPDYYHVSLPKYYSHDKVLLVGFGEKPGTLSFREHQRKISHKIHRLVHRVSELASPRIRLATSNPKSPSEVFRDSLLEATSQRDSFVDAYQ